jgi:DNA-binding NtrC family response regulator
LRNHSATGTSVNGELVSEEIRLADGDIIEFANLTARITFKEGDGGDTKTLTVARAVQLPLVLVGKKRSFPLGTTPISIGTSPDCEVPLDDAYVSGTHALLWVDGGETLVKDAGSRNGTLVNGTKVREATLRPGDVLKIGSSEFNLRVADDASSPMKRDVPSNAPAHGLVGDSPAMEKLRALLQRVASAPAPVLIMGSTGTGKEVVARAVHSASPRAAKPFVALNCGALSRSLIESELFGHEQGAFTGATRRKLGAFELAKGGTLFLDEIGELPLELQPQLLRVLENGEIRRVGGSESLSVDVRVVAATNRDLEAEVREGRFREDLFHRLHVLGLTLPSLTARSEDVPVLARHFIREFAPAGEVPALDDTALAKLRAHNWPGNVRELRNVIQRAVLMRAGDELSQDDITFTLTSFEEKVATASARAGRTLAELEREAIESELRRAGGNRTRAAEALGISRSTIHRKMEEYGIDVAPE